ncbi:MAG: UDP-N-acetylmuramate--L-alanine ligase [Phycisphaerales bacterium]
MEKKTPMEGKKYHFIGIGGVGTSALAAVLMKEKAFVSGSDMQSSNLTERLNESGATVKIGHCAENLPKELDGVIISAAVKPDNPELLEAKRRHIMIYKYAQMLGLVMDMYKGVAISGTHGKSTTTGWITYVLKNLGIDPNYVVGADIMQYGTSSGTGNGDVFVAEACEYDRSFLNLRPQVGVILNIEPDHLDYYSGIGEIVEAFADFANGIRTDGVLVASGEDKNIAKLLSQLRRDKNIVTFGLNEKCDFWAKDIKQSIDKTEFVCMNKQNEIGKAEIKLPGKHNVQNALAVIAAATSLGIESQNVLKVMGGFEGMDRRLMKKAEINGICVYDDYAHHPTEIKASLKGMRQRYDGRKIYCIFQPHQYSRTRFLLKDFADSFKLADLTIVPEIYFVRDTEKSRNEVNAQMLVDEIKKKGSNAMFINSFESICEFLKSNVKSGDILMTMGAGNVWKVADEFIQWLGTNS